MRQTIGYFRICSKHRKLITMIDNIESMINDVESISTSSHYTAESSFMIDGQRETVNCIHVEAKLSPVRSQTTAALKKTVEKWSSLFSVKSHTRNTYLSRYISKPNKKLLAQSLAGLKM